MAHKYDRTKRRARRTNYRTNRRTLARNKTRHKRHKRRYKVGGMMAAAASPEPEIERSPLKDIYTRLEQITENAKTQQAFRNGEFVLFVIKHLLDKYSIEKPTKPVGFVEQVTSLASKAKKKTTETVAETTEEALSSLPIPLSGFAARKICGKVFQKSGQEETITFMEKIKGFTNTISDAAIPLVEETLTALKKFIDEEMNSFIFPTYTRYMNQKTFHAFIVDFVNTINIKIVKQLYHEYHGTSRGGEMTEQISGHNLNEIITKGIKEVRVLNTLDRYITETFRFLTSISKVNRGRHAENSQRLLGVLKRVIEETYTGMTLTEEGIAREQAAVASRVGNQSVEAIKQASSKTQLSIGKQNKKGKQNRAVAELKRAKQVLTQSVSRDLNFSGILHLPPSIIDYDFDVETYEAVVDAFCEVCDARELLRILIDASTTFIIEAKYRGSSSVTSQDLDENLGMSTERRVSQILVAKIIPSMNRVSMDFYVDGVDTGLGDNPIYKALTKISDPVGLNEGQLQLLTPIESSVAPNSFAVITYRDPNEAVHRLLLSEEYKGLLMNTAPTTTGQHVPLILQEMSRYKSPNNLIGYFNRSVQCIVEPITGTLTMKDHDKGSDDHVRLRLYPSSYDGKIQEGYAKLSENGKLTIYRSVVMNKTMKLTSGLSPSVLPSESRGELDNLFRRTTPFVSHIHPFILASIHHGIQDSGDLLKECVLEYLISLDLEIKIEESKAQLQEAQAELKSYFMFLQDGMVEYYFLNKREEQTQGQTQGQEEEGEDQEERKRDALSEIKLYLTALPGTIDKTNIQYVPEIQALMTYLNAYDPQNPKYSIIANCYLLLKSLVVIDPGEEEEVKTRMSKVEGKMLDFFFKEG